VRKNQIPWFSGAGQIRNRADLPECNPIPSKVCACDNVVCKAAPTDFVYVDLVINWHINMVFPTKSQLKLCNALKHPPPQKAKTRRDRSA
jgi:hypothetical protein